MNALTFNQVSLNPVAQSDNQIWITSADLAMALSYKAADSVTKIFNRNSDEFDSSMTQTVKLTVSGEINGLQHKTVRVFSLRGCHLIAMFAKTSVAKQFRKWILDLISNEAQKFTGRTTTADDRTGLRHAVDAMVTKKGLLYPDVYRLVHQRFNVEHIDKLTLEQVGEATEYLHRLMLDIEKPLRVTFDKRAVESIVAVCHHVAFLRSWWDYYGEAIRKLNSNVAFCIHDHFTHANLHAGIIHSRTDLDFKLAQNMKDYPWEADYFTRQEFWRALPAK